MHATSLTHLTLLDFITLIFDEEGKLLSFSICTTVQAHVTSALFVPNILLSTLCPNTLLARDQVKVKHVNKTKE
jgi:hypothetical protein